MGRDFELSSPQNKLKDILHTIFKRHDQQEANNSIAAPDAVPAAPDAVGPPAPGTAESCAESGDGMQEEQQEQLAGCTRMLRDSAGALDANGGTAAASLSVAAGGKQPGAVPAGQLAIHSPTHAAAGPTAGDKNNMATQVHLSGLHASCTGGDASPAAMAAGQPAQDAPYSAADAGAGRLVETAIVLAGAAEDTQQQQQQQLHPGPPQGSELPVIQPPAGLPPAYPAAAPVPDAGAAGIGKAAAIQRKMMCASVDDLYQELFGDVPLPSTCSSAAHSPYGSALGGSIRGLSSMSPMTTTSAFCQQHAAAAAIAGSGGMPGLGLIPVGTPMSVDPHSNSLCSSYDGTASNFGGSAFGDFAGSGPGQLPNTAAVDDLLPPGAYPPRVRINQPSRLSGSDGGSSSLFPDESPSYCSSSVGGHPWHAACTDDASGAVSSLSQGWGSRGSMRYSNPRHAGSSSTSKAGGSPTGSAATAAAAPGTGPSTPGGFAAQGSQQQQQQQQHGTLSGPGSADSKPTPRSSLRARWSNWINGSHGSPGSRPSAQQHQQHAAAADHVQQEGAGGEDGQQQGLLCAPGPWNEVPSRQPSPQRSTLSAQSAPGHAVAARGSCPGTSNGPGAAPPQHLQQLVHCHSNPELLHMHSYSMGGQAQARPPAARALGLGGAGPPCARALFGSVPQLERPLMMAAGGLGAAASSSNSCGWPASGFGGSMRSASFGVLAALAACDDALSVASADEEVIRQVNADNVLSTTWGPSASLGSASATSHGAASGSSHAAAHHPKLLAFKYCCATSPLNHPGRSSPFGSARASPFNSPRGPRDSGSMLDLLPLRSAAAAAESSCPGSPLAGRHSNPFSADTPPPSSAAAGAHHADAEAAVPLQAHQLTPAGPTGRPQQQQQQQRASLSSEGMRRLSGDAEPSAVRQPCCVLKKQGSSSAGCEVLPLDGTDSGSICNSSGGSNSSKPPLQGRPAKGLLRTPPPPLPLPLPTPVAAAVQTPHVTPAGKQQQRRQVSRSAEGSAVRDASASGLSGGRLVGAKPVAAGATGGAAGSTSVPVVGLTASSRRVSAPAGLSALMVRFGGAAASSSGAAKAELRGVQQEPHSGTLTGVGEPDSSHGSSTPVHRASLPLPLPSCSIDMGSPRQLPAAAADSRSSPRRQSSCRVGASTGFTTPSRLSHNSTMAEALASGSGGNGGFGLQRTSSCSSSSNGCWTAGGGNGSRQYPPSSSVGCDAGVPCVQERLLSTTSVPLAHSYGRDAAGVNCSASSDGSWAAGPAAGSTAHGLHQQQDQPPAGHGHEPQQQQQQQQRVQQPEQPLQQVNEWFDDNNPCAVASLAARVEVRAVNRYSSCNGASEGSTADCQDCTYPSWCSSSDLSPLAPPNQQPQQQQQQVGRQLQPETSPDEQPQQEAGRDSGSSSSGPGGNGGEGSASGPEPAASTTAVAAAGAGGEPSAGLMPSLPEVDFLEKIGRGSFGDVFKGVWCGSVVAVKVIQVKQPSALTFPQRHSAQHQVLDGNQQAQPSGLQPLCAAAAAAATDATAYDAQAAQVALELAQHEYESWLNANLRHPNIVQLFTSFTIGLEERAPSTAGPLFSGPAGSGGGEGGSLLLAESCGAGSGLSWKTHLVMEYCELGTMQDLLQRGVFSPGCAPSGSHLAWVLSTAKEFCTAVCYLHSMDVVHGDLKSSNVLLKAAAPSLWDTRGFVAKVSDFGLSRVMDALSAANGEPPATPSADTAGCTTGDATSTAIPCDATSSCAGLTGEQTAAAAAGAAAGSGLGGSLGWTPHQHRFGALSHAAPELIRGQPLSKASDVYSIGVLLWELLTGQVPFYGLHPGQLLSLKLSLHTSQLLAFSPNTPAALSQLCLDCWQDDPAQRPSMPAIVARINALAVALLGEEAAVSMFPDVAASLAAQRRQAPPAAAVAGLNSGSNAGWH